MDTSKIENIGSLWFDTADAIPGRFNTVVFNNCSFYEEAVKIKKHMNISTRDEPTQETLQLLEILKNPDCEYIIKLFWFEHDTTNREFYVAMEAFPLSLMQWIQNDSELESREGLQILKQITLGLKHIHEVLKRNHNNLQPTNILIHPEGSSGNQVLAKLSDFCLENQRTSYKSQSAHGEYCWYSPEHCHWFTNKKNNGHKNQSFDGGPESDVFSLGCIFYFTLTGGDHPFGSPIKSWENVKKGNSDLKQLGFCNENKKELIKTMISSSKNQRPAIPDILKYKIWNEPFCKVQRRITYFKNKLINNGSCGTMVYEGEYFSKETKIMEECAVKVIRDEKMMRRAEMREISLLHRCRKYQHIVHYFDFETCVERSELLIAMEFCKINLTQFIAERNKWKNLTFRGKTPYGQIENEDILRQATEGLFWLHHENIIHRDLKPNNILLKYINGINQPIVKLADFSISKLCTGASEPFTIPYGSMGWMAPETIRNQNNPGGGEKMSQHTDIFSLGLIFCYVLSDGAHPFGEKDTEQHSNIESGNYSRVHASKVLSIRCNLPTLLKMLSKDPQKRPLPTELLRNPVFWNNSKKLLFLTKIHECVGKIKMNGVYRTEPLKEKKRVCVNTLQKKYFHECLDPFMQVDLSIIFEDYTATTPKDEKSGALKWFYIVQEETVRLYLLKNNHTKSRGTSVIGLVHVIRNIDAHRNDENPTSEFVDAFKCLMNVCDDYMSYWLNYFPVLVYNVWRVFEKLKTEAELLEFYTSKLSI